MGDPQQIELVLQQGRVVTPKRSPNELGFSSLAIEGAEKPILYDEMDSIMITKGYALDSVIKAAQRGIETEALFMVFKIGQHRVQNVEYTIDKAISHMFQGFASDSDYSVVSGYQLTPGIVIVERVLMVQRIGNSSVSDMTSPFRLEEISDKYM